MGNNLVIESAAKNIFTNDNNIIFIQFFELNNHPLMTLLSIHIDSGQITKLFIKVEALLVTIIL